MARLLLGHLDEISSHLNPESPFCLFLDFDGTLAPIRRRPEKAQISALTRSLLERLSCLKRVYVGILSGRSRQDLYRKVRIPRIIYGGCHGLEMKGPGFSYHHPSAERARPLLARIARELKEQSGFIPGVVVEAKGLSVSLHYRNVKRIRVPLLRDGFHRVIEGSSEWIEAIPGKQVLEARPKLNWNKGDAALHFLEHVRRKEGKPPFCIYMGDDRTDEDAFAALGDAGITIRVGSEQPTVARYRVRNIKEVQQFLRWLLRRFLP